MKFAILYPAYDKGRCSVEESRAARLRHAGHDIITAPFHIDKKLSPDELSARWQAGDKRLRYLYQLAEDKLQERDVLIVADTGVAHPEFLRRIKALRVLVGNAADLSAEASHYNYHHVSGFPVSDPLKPDVKAEIKWLDDLKEALAPHVQKHMAKTPMPTRAYGPRPKSSCSPTIRIGRTTSRLNRSR